MVKTLDIIELPRDVSFSASAGGANVSEITITLKDAKGNVFNATTPFNVWLSDSATGVGLTATAASGTVQAKSTEGADFGALTAKKALLVQAKASTGTYVLEITDTAKTGYYIAVQLPFVGEVFVSDQLVTADYGA